MQELNSHEIEQVGGADGFDAAAGGLTGAGRGTTALGIALGLGVTLTAPISLSVIGASAAVGSTYSWLSN
jgi:hypothetical protein